RRQAVSLPFQATLDGPTKDTCALGSELLTEVFVSFGGRNRHLEGDQQDSSPDGDIGASNCWSMIRPKPRLVRRRKVPEVLSHPACLNLIATGERFYFRLIKALTFGRLLKRYEASAEEVRQLRRVLLVFFREQEVRHSWLAVISQQGEEGDQERRLAVG